MSVAPKSEPSHLVMESVTAFAWVSIVLRSVMTVFTSRGDGDNAETTVNRKSGDNQGAILNNERKFFFEIKELCI